MTARRGSSWSRGRRRKTLLTVHVTSSVALVGSSAGLLVSSLRAATRSDPQDAHALYGLVQMLVFSLGIPLAFIALGTGVTLAVTSRWGLLRHWWVTGKLILLLGVIAVGAVVVRSSIDTMLEVTARDDASSVEWRLVAAAAFQVTMVLAATTLAIFKPGGLLRRPSRDAPELVGVEDRPNRDHDAVGDLERRDP